MRPTTPKPCHSYVKGAGAQRSDRAINRAASAILERRDRGFADSPLEGGRWIRTIGPWREGTAFCCGRRIAGDRTGAQKLVPFMGYRWFESISLQRRVREPSVPPFGASEFIVVSRCFSSKRRLSGDHDGKTSRPMISIWRRSIYCKSGWPSTPAQCCWSATTAISSTAW